MNHNPIPKNSISLFRKVQTAFMTGLTISALILVIGNGGNIVWFPPFVVFPLVGITMIGVLLFPFCWQRLEKNQSVDSNKIYAIMYGVIRYGIAINMACFGWKKIFGLQFLVPDEIANQPINQLSGEWLTWYYFGYSQVFGMIIAMIQILGAYLLLYRKTLLIGLVMLFSLMLNLTLINIFYAMNAGALLQSLITTVGIAFLILSDYKMIKRFFIELSMQNLPTMPVKKKAITSSIRWSVIVLSLLFTIYLKSISTHN